MKLLLTSGGLSTEQIKHELVRLVGKPLSEISAAIINDGHHVEAGDKRWAIDEVANVAKTVGGAIDLISLFALSIEEIVSRISQKDVLYIMGGHTDYLMSHIESSDLAHKLPLLLEDIVYVGSSAGSMIMCNRVTTDSYQKMYGEEGTYGVENYLQLIDIAIKPHLDSPDFLNNRRELLEGIAHDYHATLIALRDDQAIVVEGSIAKPQISFIGGEPLIFNPTI
jgi:peptidase E